MTIQRMLELLEIEHECMLRSAHDDCDRNCADCELVQDDYELDEMYTDVISLLKDREAKTIEQPEIVRCKDCIHNGKVEKCVLAAIAAEKGFPLFMLDNHGEWFCADGERRDDDD